VLIFFAVVLVWYIFLRDVSRAARARRWQKDVKNRARKMRRADERVIERQEAAARWRWIMGRT
jgi:hypothetical protein